MHVYEGDRKALFDGYKQRQDFFPIIGAVIEGRQQGVVYANRTIEPSSFFIVHKFGFAQFVEFESDDLFDDELTDNLFRASAKKKFRIYNVSEKWCEQLLKLAENPGISVQCGNRERFLYNKGQTRLDSGLASVMTAEKFDEVSSIFNLDIQSRFWDSKEDALKFSTLVIVSDPAIVSVCYGAAVSDSRIEIDVVTEERMQRRGYARMAVEKFINGALDNNLVPVWDCYSDNRASFELAEKVGFEHIFTYNFCILTGQSPAPAIPVQS